MEVSEFARAIRYLQARATKLVKPLLEGVIDVLTKNPKERYERGLLCVDIKDEDLPWHHENQPIRNADRDVSWGFESEMDDGEDQS